MGLVYYDRLPVEEDSSNEQQLPLSNSNTAVISSNNEESVSNSMILDTTESNSSSSSGGRPQTPTHTHLTTAPLTNELNFTNVSIASGDGQPGISSNDNLQPQHQHSVTFLEVASVYEPSPEFEFTSNNMQTYQSSSNPTNETTFRRHGRRRSIRTRNRHDENEHESGYASNRSSRSNSRHSQRSNTEGPRPGILRRSRSVSRRSSSSISSAATTMSSTIATHLNTYANSAIFYDDDEVRDEPSSNDEGHEDNGLSSTNTHRMLLESTDNESNEAATDDAISIPLNDTTEQNMHTSQHTNRFGLIHRIDNNENALETLQNTLINSTVERDFSDIITSASNQRTMSPPPPPPPEEIDVYRASLERGFRGLQDDLDDSHLFNNRISNNHTIELTNNEDEDDTYYRSYSEGDEYNSDLIMGDVRSLNVLDRDSIRIYNGYNNVLRLPLNHHRRIRIHRANRHLPSDDAYQSLLAENHQARNEQNILSMEEEEESRSQALLEKNREVDQPVLFHYCNAFYDIFAKIKSKLTEKQKRSGLIWRLNDFTQIFERYVILKNLTVSLVIDGIWLSDSLVRLPQVKEDVECHRDLLIATCKAALFVQSVDDEFEFNAHDDEYYPFYDETRVNYALGGVLKTCIPADTQEMESKLREFVREQFNPGDYIDLKRSSSEAFGNCDDTVHDNDRTLGSTHTKGDSIKRMKTFDSQIQRVFPCRSDFNGVGDLQHKSSPNGKRTKKRKVTFADV